VNIVYEITGHYKPFNFIASESDNPFECNVFKCSEKSLVRAGEEIKAAMKVLQEVNQKGSGAWIGYPLGLKDIEI
jgi:hypothetical protein